MKHIIFDLDGTLIDSSSGIYNAFRSASLDLDLSPPSKQEFIKSIGPPINLIYNQFYHDPTQLSAFVELFRFYYDTNYYRDFVFYDSLSSVLQQILNSGYSYSIVTNKPTQPSLSIIQHNSLLREHVHPLIGIDFFDSPSFNKTSFKSSSIQYISNLLQLFSPRSVLCW